MRRSRLIGRQNAGDIAPGETGDDRDSRRVGLAIFPAGLSNPLARDAHISGLDERLEVPYSDPSLQEPNDQGLQDPQNSRLHGRLEGFTH
jgi:hypothetical protein